MVIISPESFGASVKGDLGFGEIKMFDDPGAAGPGWALIAVVYTDQLETHNGSVVCYEPPYNQNGTNFGGSFQNQYVNDLSYRCRKPQFVMGRLKDKAWEELCKSRDQFKDAHKKLEQVLKDLSTERNKKVEELVGRAREAEKNEEKWRDNATHHTEMRTKAENNMKKLEGDLAKIRQEVGDKRWRELVGEGSNL